jgi:tetraacyldisaccharide 4'-kinase
MRTVRAHTAAPVATGVFVPSCDAALEGLGVLLASGIGNPDAFEKTIARHGAQGVERHDFRDHHAYTRADVAGLVAPRLPVVVTEKDAVKLAPLWPGDGPPLHVVRIRFEVQEGAADLDALFDRL